MNLVPFKPKPIVPVTERRIVLTGEVDHNMFSELCNRLSELELESDEAPVLVEVSSIGGNTQDALAIVGRLHASPCPIHTVGYGQIMSAATLIFAAGERRLMSKYAWFMIHDASDRFAGPLTKVKREVKQLEREELQWIDLLEQFTGVPKALWAELTANSAHLTATECKNLQIVDELF